MAETTILNGSGVNPIRVQEKLISTIAERENVFSSLIGEGKESVIQILTDLRKNPGDTIKVNLRGKLSGEGVDGDGTLEGNEEAMSFFQDTCLIDQKRHAIRLAGQMTEQRSAINLRKEAGPALGTWGAEWLTEMITYYLSGARGVRTGELILPTTWTGFASNALQAPDSDHILYAGSAGTKAGMAGTDKMTVALLDKVRRQIALLINVSGGAAMRPIRVKGKPYFVCVLTPEQRYDLEQDTVFMATLQQAAERGDTNDLFTGSLGTWRNLVLYENPTGVLFDDYGSGSVKAARALVLGAQAGVMAFGNSGGTDAGAGRWKYIEKNFDYENQAGFAVETILGVKKLQLNSKDFGVFALDTAYTA